MYPEQKCVGQNADTTRDNHEHAAHRGTRGRGTACFEGPGYSVIKGNSESLRTRGNGSVRESP